VKPHPLWACHDFIKILVINHKRLCYISIKHRWCNFDVIHKFVSKSKMYSVWSTVYDQVCKLSCWWTTNSVID